MILKSFYRNNNYFPSLNKFVNLPKKLHYHDDYGQRMYNLSKIRIYAQKTRARYKNSMYFCFFQSISEECLFRD